MTDKQKANLTDKERAIAISVAGDELRKYGLNHKNFRAYLQRENGIIFVTYVNNKILEEASGVGRKNPRLEVEIEVEGMHLIRSYFVQMSTEQLPNYENFSEKQKTLAISSAASELRRLKLDPANYRVCVQREKNILFVIYVDKEIPEGARGIKAKNPTVEVEVGLEDMQVIRSYFVR